MAANNGPNGFFDFDGDGNTDPAEEWLASEMFEEDTAEEDDWPSRTGSRKRNDEIIIPAHVTEAQYRHIKSKLRSDNISTVLAMAVMLFLPLAMTVSALWVGTDNGIDGVSGTVLIAGVGICIAIVNIANKKIAGNKEKREQLEKVYRKDRAGDGSIGNNG